MHQSTEVARKNICRQIAGEIVRENPDLEHTDLLLLAVSKYRAQIQGRTDLRYCFGDESYMSWWLSTVVNNEKIKSRLRAPGVNKYREAKGK